MTVPTEILLVDDGTGTAMGRGADSWTTEVAPPLAEVDVYDLPGTLDASRHAGVFLSGGVDQEFLYRERRVFELYLAGGGVVVWCGHLLRRWLPGCEPFEPAEIRSMHDYAVRIVADHPIYAGIDPGHLTFRRGVAGFFARGSHPVPAGADVLAELAGGQPITYVERRGGGTVLAHAGQGLFQFGGDDSAARLGPQCAAWIRDESRRLRTGVTEVAVS